VTPSGRTLNFPFPIKGMDRFWSNRQQPMLTSPDLLNVRSFDPIEERTRGGQRAGLRKYYHSQLGDTENERYDVRMLGQVSTAKTASSYTGDDEDDFNRPDKTTLGDGWAGINRFAWRQQIINNQAYGQGVARMSADRRTGITLSLTDDYEISIDIRPSFGVYPNEGWNKCRKYLFARMDDAAPDPVYEGAYLWMEFVPDNDALLVTCTGYLAQFKAGVQISLNALAVQRFSIYKSVVTLSLAVTNSTIVTAKLDGVPLAQKVFLQMSGSQVGFGSQQLGVYDNPTDNWRVHGTLVGADPTPRKTALVVACGGKTYYESEPGEFTELTGDDAAVSYTHSIMCAELGGSLYIADYGEGFAPKVYSASNNTIIEWVATAGTLPQQCPLICSYRNRIVLGKDQTWYMSKQGDPLDWDTTATGIAAAVSGTTADAGQVGERLSAMVPWSDDYLIFASQCTLYILRGDPNEAGRIDIISHNVGIIDKFAWCHDPNGTLYFLGEDGFYKMAPGAQPVNLSENNLPVELGRVNIELTEPILQWDKERHGVMIYLTARASGPSVHWFYDIRTEGFFRDVYQTDHGPTAARDYGSDSKFFRKMVLGGRDGYLRTMDRFAKEDDGAAIESYVIYAPQRLAKNEMQAGIIQLTQMVTALGTDAVDYEIRLHNTHEYAWRAVARESGTWSGGKLQYTNRTRLRGGSVAIKLGRNTSGSYWGVEKLMMVAKAAGMVEHGAFDMPIAPPWQSSTGSSVTASDEPSWNPSSSWSSMSSSSASSASSISSSSLSSYSSSASSSSSSSSSSSLSSDPISSSLSSISSSWLSSQSSSSSCLSWISSLLSSDSSVKSSSSEVKVSSTALLVSSMCYSMLSSLISGSQSNTDSWSSSSSSLSLSSKRYASSSLSFQSASSSFNISSGVFASYSSSYVAECGGTVLSSCSRSISDDFGGDVAGWGQSYISSQSSSWIANAGYAVFFTDDDETGWPFTLLWGKPELCTEAHEVRFTMHGGSYYYSDQVCGALLAGDGVKTGYICSLKSRTSGAVDTHIAKIVNGEYCPLTSTLDWDEDDSHVYLARSVPSTVHDGDYKIEFYRYVTSTQTYTACGSYENNGTIAIGKNVGLAAWTGATYTCAIDDFCAGDLWGIVPTLSLSCDF